MAKFTLFYSFNLIHVSALTFRLEMIALWNELREWRKHWSAKKFFQALVFGLLFSVLDMETDFAFAWSVPDQCPKEGEIVVEG